MHVIDTFFVSWFRIHESENIVVKWIIYLLFQSRIDLTHNALASVKTSSIFSWIRTVLEVSANKSFRLNEIKAFEVDSTVSVSEKTDRQRLNPQSVLQPSINVPSVLCMKLDRDCTKVSCLCLPMSIDIRGNVL